MTRVSIVSDLHLEFGDCELPGGDILVMAGDTLTAKDLDFDMRESYHRKKVYKRFLRFAKEEMPKYERVIEIAGNHTFYGTSIARAFELERSFWAEHAPNVVFLENECVVIEGTCFIGTTLWATCGVGNPVKERRIRTMMNDFNLIKTERPLPDDENPQEGLQRFTPRHANAMHQDAIAYLQSMLADTKRDQIPVIVVGHHAPSFRSKIEGGRSYDNGVDEAYYSNQDVLIKDNPHIVAWIHGHTHDSCFYEIGTTKIISNQRGYVGQRSANIFDANAANFKLETARIRTPAHATDEEKLNPK